MFACGWCEKESVIVARFCENCQVMKRICNIYGAKDCKEILERVCIRNTEQRNYKITAELKKDIENVKNTDESYIKPKKHTKSV